MILKFRESFHARKSVLLFLAATLVLCFVSSGCSGSQSALNPGGAQAGTISNLWWFYFWITLTIYIAVLFLLITSIIRTSSTPILSEANRQIIRPEEKSENRRTALVGIAVGISLLLLFVLFLGDLFVGRSLHSLKAANALTIKIIGHQWWWEAIYEDPIASNTVTTANEIHIPVGKPIQIKLDSRDVIHSFWVPNLHGKKDLIPGHPTTLWLMADKAGTYKGQCAEFCGHQHAHMRLLMVAEEQGNFNQWLSHERSNASIPTTASQMEGEKLFSQGTCITCHTIQGTLANGKVGPNLTHIASRKLLAAGRLPNTRDDLASWIFDPQHLKPGVKMPQHNLPPGELQSLVEYLESLK